MTASRSKLRELIDEFRSVVVGRGQVLDVLLPPLVYLGVQAIASAPSAALAALVVGAGLTVLRLLRRQSATYAILGLGGSVAAFAASVWLGRSELFFVPEILTRAGLAALCLVSVLARRPLVAFTSHLVRRWPRDWYWHPRVRPAYTETTLVWGLFFVFQALLQWELLETEQVAALAFASLLNGWPATVFLLVVTYLYGTWRLIRLAGPSVAEWQAGQPSPWTGQRTGF